MVQPAGLCSPLDLEEGAQQRGPKGLKDDTTAFSCETILYFHVRNGIAVMQGSLQILLSSWLVKRDFWEPEARQPVRFVTFSAPL